MYLCLYCSLHDDVLSRISAKILNYLLNTRSPLVTPDCSTSCLHYCCCVVLEKNCTGDSCVEEDPEQDCPEDSYRLGSAGCQCLPTLCLTKACPWGSPKVVRPGNGKAGSCCPLYACISAGKQVLTVR